MRTVLAAVALLAGLSIASAREAAVGFPAPLIGLWAETPITCDLLRRSPANAPRDRSWVRITPETVSGTTNGKFIRTLGPRAAQTTDENLSTITIDFELKPGGVLFETVTGARASMQYMRCH